MPPIGRSYTYHPDHPATTAQRQRRFAQKRRAEVAELRRKTAQRVYLQSIKQDYGTPRAVFDEYDREFGFTLDVCAHAGNHKCARYYTPEMDGLTQDWGRHICWMNPPFNQIRRWLRKAYLSSQLGATVVCLVPARTGAQWWQTWVVHTRADVRYRTGRIRFDGSPHHATFDVAIVVYWPWVVRQRRLAAPCAT
jgi:site-specific DNA-methyltransferase (adenine-specific)